ncbi:MAG: nitrophenyl compound nitroreductase subunit ArsF family protein [Proteobacteria bacterium]|nr:nitrophenyl compound nitroreductase subunit ArsF family protein [Pseudomonadota bacterium]
MMGKIKSLVLFLLALGLWCLYFVNVSEQSLTDSCSFAISRAQAGEAGAVTTKKEKDSGYVVAYYFHGNYRCSSCRTIEQYSREAIEENFLYQLEKKKLFFKVINIDLPENKHFIQDYQLYTRSLIVAGYKDGKQVVWKNLTKVWEYLGDQDKFHEYVRLEIQKSLEKM